MAIRVALSDRTRNDFDRIGDVPVIIVIDTVGGSFPYSAVSALEKSPVLLRSTELLQTPPAPPMTRQDA